MKHPKTLGREIALQFLYMHDVLEGKDVQPLSDFLGVQAPPPDADTATFTRALVETVLEHRDELDVEIAEAAINWKIHRMAIVDRNILRLGLAELGIYPDTPFKVVINEAVELARRFSSEASCAFVNGLLDKLRVRKDGAGEDAPSENEGTEGASTEDAPVETPAVEDAGGSDASTP